MLKVNKLLIKFSFKQLVQLNIHLGIKTNFWNPIVSKLLIGFRQNHFFLNINLSVLNLRNSFQFIELCLKTERLVLFFNDNLILNNLLLTNLKLFRYLKLFFGLGKWVNGFLSNFPSFRFQIRLVKKKLFKYLKKKIFKKFFKLNKNKIWTFLLFLRKMKRLPSGVFLMFPNMFAIFETLKLHIVSMALLDLNQIETIYLSSNYIIPFNYFNFYSLFFLFTSFKHLILINIINKKKLFFLLINHWLNLNFKFIKKNIKLVNIFFNQYLLLKNYKQLKKLKYYKFFTLLNLKNLVK